MPASRYGVGGRVLVEVKLDAQGRVDGTRVTSYSSGFFVHSAVVAARASTYVPAVRDCAPVASTYVFEATYDVPDVPPPVRVDPLAYLPGAWRCTGVDGRAHTVLFVRNGNGLDRMTGATITSFAPDEYRMWRIRENGKIVGWAYPWTDETWVWSRHLSSEPQVQMRRIDAATLYVTQLVGTSVPKSEEGRRCTRVAAAP